MMAFERYAIGEIHETLERYKLGKRQQQEDESRDTFLADLRILMKTVNNVRDVNLPYFATA